MELQIWQVVVLSLYATIQKPMDVSFGQYAISRPVTAGFITGLVMGDVTTGLFIGASLELASLGVATYGGASIPDYNTATVIGTALAVVGGLAPDEAVGLAIPVAILMVQLDVFGRMTNTLIAQFSRKQLEKGNYKNVIRLNFLGVLPWGLSRGIPVAIALIFGSAVVEEILALIPDALMTGLGVAAGLLPVVGIAILLRYLPFSKLFIYFLLGFTLSGVFGLNLLMVTLVGFILVFIMYQIETTGGNNNGNGNNTEGLGAIDD